MAMLFHPLQGWSEDEMCLDSTPEMEKLSKKMHGQLRSNQDGAFRIVRTRFVVCRCVIANPPLTHARSQSARQKQNWTFISRSCDY